MMFRLAPVFLFFLLVLAFFVLLARPDSAPSAGNLPRPLPALALVDVNGAAVTVPQNEWVLVNFFASWCVPCVLEHPQIMSLQPKLPIVGINYRDQQVNMQAFLSKRGNPYAVVAVDSTGAAALAFGISGVPESFLINPAGQIIWHSAGPIMASQLAEIEELLDAR